ncbi:MAG: HpcH/HpaI aldolase/citrate lyase family protein [Alphaproteobacteria bacterium]|nr:HpcH/HpaI aldolase/citrate lyase family protein [Alphaproteobacteria bacterium]
MELKKNTFKAALKEGRPQLGIWSSFCSPVVSEMLANAGFDWTLIDAEHAPLEIADLLPLLQASAAGPAMPAVRPPWNDKVLIKRVLDIGAQTILLPFVENPEEAAAAVRACRYPPDGIRGVAGATRASGYGKIKDYLHRAQDEICILVQVETGAALAQLSEIASTDGVDGVFIGPSDLSASLGHLGNPGHPDVQTAIKQAAQTIRAAGKAPGILAVSADDAQRYLDWGYLFVACGIDTRILSAGLDDLAKKLGR